MKGVPRQSFLPACCLIGKCYRNFAALNCRVSARELVDVRRPATRCLTQLVHTLHKSSCFLRQRSHRIPGFAPRLAVIVGVRRQCEQFLIASKADSTGTAYRWAVVCLPMPYSSVWTLRGFTLSWRSGQSVASLGASPRADQSSDDMLASLAGLPSHRRLWARFSM